MLHLQHDREDEEATLDFLNAFDFEQPALPPSRPVGRPLLHLSHPPLHLPWRPADGACTRPCESLAVRPAASAALSRFAEIEGGGASWLLNHFRIDCHGTEYLASILQPSAAPARQRPPPAPTELPLLTGEALYLPATYTLLASLLPRSAALAGRRVIELGCGLGLASSVLQQMRPPPARLVSTDGNASLLPLLRANLDANQPDLSAPTEVLQLLWGSPLPSNLAGSFDFVVAADTIFCTTPPQGARSRSAHDGHTMHHVNAFFRTAAALLDPSSASEPHARIVLSAEPRDRLKPPSADPLRALVPAAASAAGLRRVELQERSLKGELQPDWATDLMVFERTKDGSASATPAAMEQRQPRVVTDEMPGNHAGAWREKYCSTRQVEEHRQSRA